jgi:hypothetical protein
MKGLTLKASPSAATACYVGTSLEFTFRGIEFFFPPDDKTTLLGRRGSKTRKKLTEAWESFGEVHSWKFRHAESVFSLGVYASSALGVATHPHYYVYKYVRGRHRLLAQGVISQNSLANVWPSIVPLWRDWIKGLLDQGRSMMLRIMLVSTTLCSPTHPPMQDGGVFLSLIPSPLLFSFS